MRVKSATSIFIHLSHLSHIISRHIAQLFQSSISHHMQSSQHSTLHSLKDSIPGRTISLNAVYQYLYSSLISYPPPAKVNIMFHEDACQLVSRFYRGVAAIMRVPVSELIYSLSRSMSANPDMILDNNTITTIFERHLLPITDDSTRPHI